MNDTLGESMLNVTDPRELVGWQDAVDVAMAKLALAESTKGRIEEVQTRKYREMLQQGQALGYLPRADAVARHLAYLQSRAPVRSF